MLSKIREQGQEIEMSCAQQTLTAAMRFSGSPDSNFGNQTTSHAVTFQ